MTPTAAPCPALDLYGVASEHAADRIIRAYSTSFGAATRLLGPRHRRHIRNVYALVRVADELVDGVAAEAHLTPAQQLARLDALEAETHEALDTGYSSNPIVHAFAVSARLADVDRSLTEPFFASMRMDLRVPIAAQTAVGAAADGLEGIAPRGLAEFDGSAHAEYVFGSAEVIGLMCLRVFLRDEQRSRAETRSLEAGARSLGAAFQNINFLRDIADDTERLARSYLSDGAPMTESLKMRWIGTIRRQLAEAEAVLPLLPHDARAAVDCARRLFARLADKLERTPAERLLTQRIRVSNPMKAVIVVRAIASARKGAAA